MIYRREIDGLRAVAVLPVVLFHAGFELFSGGYVGVDIFFVISGYLITTIILAELENDRFSLTGFYERRARRILPALALVVLACIPAALWLMNPAQLTDFSNSIIAVSLFSSNLLFWRESGYFSAAAEEKPLLHTWSLAVEEQYYILFPLFLMLLWRSRREAILPLIMLFTVASLLLAEWGWRHSPTANFYLAPTRAWELMIGAIAAFWRLHPVTTTHALRSELASLLGLVLIIVAIFVYDEGIPFPSAYALLPTLGAALIILHANPGNITGRLLGHRYMVGIGLLSYSIYLWHQPLLAFARIRLGEAPGHGLAAVLVAATVLLAWLTWKYVEAPFRNPRRVPRRAIFAGTATTLSALVALGIYGNISSSSQQNLDPLGKSFLAAYQGKTLATSHYRQDCNFYLHNTIPASCLSAPGQQPVTLIWGDSHAQAISAGLREVYSGERFFAQVATSSCRPEAVSIRPEDVPRYPEEMDSSKRQACLKANATAMALIRSGRVESVVFAVKSGYSHIDWLGLSNTLRQHKVQRVFIVGPYPQWKPSLPFAFAQNMNTPDNIDSYLNTRVFDDDEYLKRNAALAGSAMTKVLRPIGVLCTEQGSCQHRIPPRRENDFLVAFDYGHLSYSGSIYLAEKLFSQYF